MVIDAPTATLIAACTAGFVSILNLLLSQRAGRGAEARAQYRELLKPHVALLGESLHQILACATVVKKRAENGEPIAEWLDRTKKACSALHGLRLKIKYPLWGLDDAFRQLVRLGSWLGHNIDRKERREQLLETAESLRRALDVAVREAYLEGRPPKALERWRIQRLAERLRGIWNEGAASTEDVVDASDIVVVMLGPQGEEPRELSESSRTTAAPVQSSRR